MGTNVHIRTCSEETRQRFTYAAAAKTEEACEEVNVPL